MEGRRETFSWALEVAGTQGAVLETPAVGVFFWHSVPPGPADRLPDTFVDGLVSAVRHSGLEVLLFTYNKLKNVPPGVRVKDCTATMGRRDFDGLVRQFGVQLVADFIRCSELQRRGGGWFLDGDCLWLRRAPTLSILDPDTMGHFSHPWPRPPSSKANPGKSSWRTGGCATFGTLASTVTWRAPLLSLRGLLSCKHRSCPWARLSRAWPRWTTTNSSTSWKRPSRRLA